MSNELLIKAQPQRPILAKATLFVAFALGVYWAILFYCTHTRLPPGLLPGNSDKFVHFGAYAVLGVLLICLRATRGTFSWISVAARWVFLAAYGAFDELTQLLVNRTADLHDWYADIFGAAVGLCATTVAIRWLRKLPGSDRLNRHVVADGLNSVLPAQPSALAE